MNDANQDAITPVPKSRSIIELTCDEARSFFLKKASYSTIDLPSYFNFDNLIAGISRTLNGRLLSNFWKENPRDYENVNYLIVSNKDGRHAWRPLQLIHPVIYVSLVNSITSPDYWASIIVRFKEFAKNEKIKCLSLPVISLTEETDKAEQISRWWDQIEQKSIELALEYESVIHTDITDCYGSIYTHSISWAIHTKAIAKSNREDYTLIGNVIDKHMQYMRHGQTNGIPQGSVLMDFVAEMVLGYADIELSRKIAELQIADYYILRYRDDYRIFVNNSQYGERILKCLTEVMIDLGFKLNPLKTKISNQVICSSIKDDKRSWACKKQSDNNLLNHLLIIHNHSIEYPNSGSLLKGLSKFYRRICGQKKYDHAMPLISIVVDIAYHNPRTYPISAAILSKFIKCIKTCGDRKRVIEMIQNKFSQIPNAGHMEIWLQRISHKFDDSIVYNEPLCCLVSGKNEKIWNSEWIRPGALLKAVDVKKIIDQKSLAELDIVISEKEVAVFLDKAEYQ